MTCWTSLGLILWKKRSTLNRSSWATGVNRNLNFIIGWKTLVLMSGNLPVWTCWRQNALKDKKKQHQQQLRIAFHGSETSVLNCLPSIRPLVMYQELKWRLALVSQLFVLRTPTLPTNSQIFGCTFHLCYRSISSWDSKQLYLRREKNERLVQASLQ